MFKQPNLYKKAIVCMKTCVGMLSLVLFWVIPFTHLRAQSAPTYIPPSPEVSALFKSMDYSVNNASGLAPVSIPIYEIKSGSITVPINISYNASGRKVFDVTGPVGMGWSLNCGGAISRTVHGRPDDQYYFPSTFRSASTLSNSNVYDYYYLAGLTAEQGQYTSSPLEDPEYDIFSYYCGNTSGKFIVEHTSNGNQVRPLKITADMFVFGNTAGGTNAYPNQIKDAQGNTFKFEVNEVASGYNSGLLNPPVTNKLLTSITSADGFDVITFTYTPVTQYAKTYTQEITFTDDRQPTTLSSPPPVMSQPQNLQDAHEYQVQRLTEISFRQGKVKFILYPGTDQIQKIQITNLKNEVIKTVEFRSTELDSPVFATPEPTYKLDSLLFQSQTGQTIERYSFEYNAAVKFYTQDRDRWGYLNNASGSPANSVVVQPVSNIPVYQDGIYQTYAINGGNRYANSSSISGVLKKITFPTGGSTEFAYEANRYATASGSEIGPGLRVFQIKSTDGSGSSYIKTYRYGYNEDGIGSVVSTNFPTSAISYEQMFFNEVNAQSDAYMSTYRKRVYSSEFRPGIAEIYNEPVQYSYVTEYQGTPANNNGKTIFQYDIFSNKYAVENMPAPSFGFGSSKWPSVDFSKFHFDPDVRQAHIVNYNYWKEPVLRSATVYKNNGNDISGNPTYKVVKFTGNNYQLIQTGSFTGIHINRYIQFGNVSTLMPNIDYDATNMQMPVFLYADYNITTGKEELVSTSVEEYSDQGSLTKTTTYTYNNKGLPVNVTTNSSKGEVLTAQTKYPQDFVSDPVMGSVSQAMVNANMIAVPVEQVQTITKGGTTSHVSSTRTNYYNWGFIAPQTVEAKKGIGTYETRLRYHSYDDKGNVTTVSKENDVKKTYLWGYNKTYPVAEITGVDYAIAASYVDQSILDNPTDDAALRTHLANLRNIPGALVTTYTFRPLVGMTSQTDPKGRTTYFEYDSFGRLAAIRDQNNLILKTFAYKYTGLPESVYDGNASNTYARMEFSNYYWDVDIQYASVVIKFYSDPACTIPKTVSNLSVNYSKLKTVCSGGSTTTNYTVVCSGSQYSLGNQIVTWDNGSTKCEDYDYFTISGTGYTASTSIH